jgi:hypothetical protein
MHLTDLHRLQRLGGPTLQFYEELTAQADMSAHNSSAAFAKAQFEKDWEQDPSELVERVREVAQTQAAEE